MQNNPAVILYDSNGVAHAVQDGVAIPANTPRLLVAGAEGTNARTLRTAADGTVRVDPTGTTIQPVSADSLPLPTGAATEDTLATRASQATLAAFASIAATEATLDDARDILDDIRSGAGVERIDQPVTVIGPAAEAAAAANNPVRVAGWDGTNIRTLKTDSLGRLQLADYPTFIAAATNVTLGNNKSMLSLLNVDATLLVKVREVWIVNSRTANVTGVVAAFEARRITGHSAGTVIAPQSHDTADALDADITARTGATVAGEAATLLWRRLWSSDEWGPGTHDTEAAQVGHQQVHPNWQSLISQRPIVLRQNQGLTIKCATNTVAGTFDLYFVFTVE